VRQITTLLNGRFAGSRKVAKATSPSYIELRVPPAFREDPFHYLALVRHLYLPQRPGFAEDRARKLAEEIIQPDAPYPDIALAWEGIGRTILPIVQELYTHEREQVRVYAAIAGLRMGDDVAVEVLSQTAGDDASELRLTAIDVMGRAGKSLRAAGALRRLLDDPDPRIRVEAYEALLARGDRVVRSEKVGERGFWLDRVPSAAGNLVYVRRTGTARIALLGSRLRCGTPVFYRDRNKMITISGDLGDEDLTLVRRTPFGGRQSPPLPGPKNLGELIHMLGDDPQVRSRTDVHGLALDYSTIARTLNELSLAGAVNAEFMLQTTSVRDMFGSLSNAGRAESDL
jgi:hypothetical protein